MPKTASIKTYEWRKQNREVWLDYHRDYQAKKFEQYKAVKTKNRNAKYNFDKTWKSYLSILNNFFD
jgi:hypothetical protein